MPKNAQRFHGLMTFVDPKDIPEGFMVQQRNLGCYRPGRLDVRKGLKPLGDYWDYSPSGTVDAISCNCYVTPLRRYVVYEKADGSVKAVYDGGATANVVTGLSTFQPISVVRDSYGALLMVNGIERGYRWDGINSAVQIGIKSPIEISGVGNSAPVIAQTGSANKLQSGTYIFAYRYKDADGFYSNLSEITTVVVDATADADSPDWSSIDQSSESRVTHIELLRSAANAPHQLYRVATITNGTTTYSADDYSDDDLILFDPEDIFPFREEDGVTIHLNRFDLPPNDKPFIAQYQDVTFYYGRVLYQTGSIAGTNASATITGTSTEFRTEMIGRKLRISGQSTEYEITAVDEGLQTLTISPAASSSGAFSTSSYVISPDDSEINLLRWSGRGESEAVNAFNAARLQDIAEAQDLETGLFQYGPYLYILHEYHIYQVTFQRDPRYDLSITLLGYRGAVNNRCCVNAGGVPYFMDQLGVYRLNGGVPEDVSPGIRNFFNETIDWSPSSARYYFATYEPRESVIRFHVRYTGDTGTRPKRALCYNVENNQWWDELYPYELAGGCNIVVDGAIRLVLTADDDRAFLYGEGYCDGASTVIPWSLKTGMYRCAQRQTDDGTPVGQQVRREMQFRYRPLSAAAGSAEATATLKIYANYDASPLTSPISYVGQRNMNITRGSASITFDMSAAQYIRGSDPGYKNYPLDERFNSEAVTDQFYSFSLEGEQSTDQVSITGLDFIGYE